ncbi:PHP-associated domain-containing protein [Natronomonas sp. EA1]|uniref:PHP-associated domain-containing protein n=1 Tax=Natronomonas sp. EA1 TaxID=3421655 RepID=UPI003EBB11A3
MHVKVLDERVVARAKRRGLDALVYAPHFERLPAIRARARRFSDEDLLVVPAREIFTGDWRSRKHVLALGLSEPVPDFITLEGAMAELDRQDAAVCIPHPEFLTVSFDAGDLATYRDQVDAIEVYNPKHREADNERARELARETGLPAFGSSYAHMRRTIGEVWTSFEESFETSEEFVAAIKAGAPRRVYHRDGPLHTLRRHAEFAHLGYENTWKKADRLFLQGMEPTHPDHVAYDGAFDDISVY